MADASALDWENPGNPGSRGHPSSCKPCNKFNPARPQDSCKHGQECEFCHCQHERPKHRGQRGRHALQRRQFLETRHELPEELCQLVDRIYDGELHNILDDVKRRLQGVPVVEREEKVGEVIERIREIGEQAQRCRPDNARLRGARITTIEASTLTELDGRFKWLVGTLHLMIRKMHDAKDSKIQETVEAIMGQCRGLPEVMEGGLHQPDERPRSDESAQLQQGNERSELINQHPWLQCKLQALEEEALKSGASREEVDAALSNIKSNDEVLANALASADKDLQERLQESPCLKDFAALIALVLDGYTEALLAAESLDDLQPRPDGAYFPGADPQPAAGCTGLSGAGDESGGALGRLDARLAGLEEGCSFLLEAIRELARGALRGEALPPEAEGQLDGILQECEKLPKAIEAMSAPQPGLLRLFETPQDVERAVCRKLLPSDSLEQLLAKLRELNL